MKITKSLFKLEIEITPTEVRELGRVVDQTYTHGLADSLIAFLNRLLSK